MDRFTERSHWPDGHWIIPLVRFANEDWELPWAGQGVPQAVIDRLAAYEDTGMEPEEVTDLVEHSEITPQQEYLISEKADSIIAGLKELLTEVNERDHAAELLRAESEGRLIVLPCKVGDTVYVIEPNLCDLRDKDTCDAYCDGWDFSCPDFHSGNTIRQRHFQVEGLRRFGKTVFPSHEEAAAALGDDT